MIEGLTFASALNKFAQRRELCFAKISLELEIKFHARTAKRVREQVLGIEARILNPVFLEICGRRLQHFKEGHTRSIVIPSESLALSEVEWVEESLTVI